MAGTGMKAGAAEAGFVAGVVAEDLAGVVVEKSGGGTRVV